MAVLFSERAALHGMAPKGYLIDLIGRYLRDEAEL
jgi:hypothetical protein